MEGTPARMWRVSKPSQAILSALERLIHTFDNLITDLDEIRSLGDVGGNGDDSGRVEALSDALVSDLGEDICSASDEATVCYVRLRSALGVRGTYILAPRFA